MPRRSSLMLALTLVATALLALLVLQHASTPVSAQITGRWAFCGVAQGPSFYSVVSALITSSATTPTTYNGNSNAYRVVNSTTGVRSFYNLTMGSTATLQQSANLISVDGPGSVGGNSNYFFPTSTPALDGDGITFAFDTIPLIDGQGNALETGASRSMNFWFTSGQYAEETRSGTHETSAFASSLTITPVPTTTTTLPTCSPVQSVTFTFCFVMAAQAYSVRFSGTFTTTGIATRIAPSSGNALPSAQQAVIVTGATGTRVFTDYSTGATTTRNIVSLLPSGTFIGNTNYMYPSGAVTTDWNGIAFMMDGVIPIAGRTSTSTNMTLWWEPSVSQYIEETASGQHESTPLYSSFTVLPVSTLSPSSTPPACSIPTTISSSTIYYSLCSQLVSTTFTSVMSGMLRLQNVLLSTSDGRQYYLVTDASGSRTYTNLTTGVSTTNYIVGLAPAGSLGGNNNRLYVGGATIVDGDGLTFLFDSMPPIADQGAGSTSNNQMNYWYESGASRYLEETAGGRHEATPTTSSVTVQVANVGAAAPVCTLPSASASTGESLWLMCATLVGSSYTSAVSALLSVNTTRVVVGGQPGYLAKRATGSRTYTSLTSATTLSQQTTYITQLNPPGSLGGNDNYIFPLSVPVLNGNGLTFSMNTMPLIAGQTGTGTTSMNFWFESGPAMYLEENAGGRHESTPVTSTMTLTPYAPASLGVGPQCNIPSTVTVSFCFLMVGSTFTTRFTGLFSLSSMAVPIAATSNNQLTQTQQAFTVVGASGRREYTNLTTGAVRTANVVSVAPGFIGATNYVYFDNTPVTDWNGIAFNMDAAVPIAGMSDAGNTFVLWYERSVSQFIEETASGRHETTPTYSSFVVQSYSGTMPTCAIPTSAQNVLYFSFCARMQSNLYASAVSGVLAVSNVVLLSSGRNAYLVVAANGTRSYMNTTYTQVANLLSLAAVGSMGGNDNMLFFDSQPALNGNGLTFWFDREPIINGQPLSTTPGYDMNLWFGNSEQQYLEETTGSSHETTPLSSSFTIQPWNGGAVPMCSNPGPAVAPVSSSASAVVPPGGEAGSSSSSLSGGQIAGVVIGVIIGALLIVALCYLAMIRRGKASNTFSHHSERHADESSVHDDETEMTSSA